MESPASRKTKAQACQVFILPETVNSRLSIKILSEDSRNQLALAQPGEAASKAFSYLNSSHLFLEPLAGDLPILHLFVGTEKRDGILVQCSLAWASPVGPVPQAAPGRGESWCQDLHADYMLKMCGSRSECEGLQAGTGEPQSTGKYNRH